MQRDLVDRANFGIQQMDCFGPPQFLGKGRFFTLAGLQYAFLVVNQTAKLPGRKPYLASKREKPVK
jgi:hypothetical protein